MKILKKIQVFYSIFYICIWTEIEDFGRKKIIWLCCAYKGFCPPPLPARTFPLIMPFLRLPLCIPIRLNPLISILNASTKTAVSCVKRTEKVLVLVERKQYSFQEIIKYGQKKYLFILYFLYKTFRYNLLESQRGCPLGASAVRPLKKNCDDVSD